jgi:hypothetical protein
MNKTILSWQPVAAAAALVVLNMLGTGAAWAAEDDLPLSLTLAHDILRDNNFAKDDQNKYSETVNSTSAQASLNKSYGRQTYQGGLNLAKHWYSKLSYLNYDSKDANAAFSSELGRDWLVSLNGSFSDTLNPIQNNIQGDRVERNMKKYRDGGFQVTYGVGGTVAGVVYGSKNKLSYSSAGQQYQNANQRVTGAKAVYYSTDLLNYSLGVRRVVTDRPLNQSYQQVLDKNIDLAVNYQVTGLSRLSGTLTRQATSYVPDELAGNKTWVGSAYWTYTPHGLFSYDLNVTRLTGADRQSQATTFTNVSGRTNNDTITTVFEAAAHLQLTNKVRFTLSQNVSHYKVDQAQVYLADGQVIDPNLGAVFGFNSSSTQASSYGHSTTLAMSFAALRSVSLGCSVQRYSQGGDIYRIRYSGHSFDCYGNFTLNPN